MTMPVRAPSICPCGHRVPSGALCACQVKSTAARTARHDAQRPSARERGYDSKWDKERAAFLKLNPTCRMCSDPSTVVDHIIPHRGDLKLFWRRSNWQPLCQHHHASAKQAQENRENRP